MADLLEFELAGLPELTFAVSVAIDALNGEMWQDVWEGFIRELPTPGLSVPVVDERFTLTGMLRESFDTGGLNAYNTVPWEGYGAEPVYEAYKADQGGGADILVWAGAQSSLRKSLEDENDPFHVETVAEEGFDFGTSKDYAARLQEGGFHQPWDDIIGPARPFLYITQVMALEIARGAQRVLVGRLQLAGLAPGPSLPRVFPSFGNPGASF